jgi:hypothetical protein
VEAREEKGIGGGREGAAESGKGKSKGREREARVAVDGDAGGLCS